MFVEAVVFLSVIVGVLLALSTFIFHMLTARAAKKNDGWKEEVEAAVDVVCDAALEEITKTSRLVLDELEEKYRALLFVYQLMDDKEKNLQNGVLTESMAASVIPPVNPFVDKVYPGTLRDIDIKIDDGIDVAPITQAIIPEPLAAEQPVQNIDEPVSDEEDLLKEHLLKRAMTDEPVTEEAAAEIDLIKEILRNGDLINEPIESRYIYDDHKTENTDSHDITETENAPLPRVSRHPKYTMIKELLDGGLGIAEIARKLDMGQGEVQLIIGFSGRT